MHARSPPQSGQSRCSGGTSCTTRLRGRLAGKGLRPWPLVGGFAGAGAAGSGVGFEFGRCLGSGRFEDLAREEQELVGVELLGLPAVDPAEELFELVLEMGVEVGLLAEGREQFADEPVGGLEVVGEWGVGVDRRHTINTHGEHRCDTESSIEHTNG